MFQLKTAEQAYYYPQIWIETEGTKRSKVEHKLVPDLSMNRGVEDYKISPLEEG